MQKYRLFCGNARFVDAELHWLLKVDANGETGYIVVADLYLPPEYHDLYKDFALFHVKSPTDDMLSDWQRANFAKIGCKIPTDERLIGCLGAVKNYICDLRLLQALVNNYRVVVTKVETVIAFHQSYHMKPHIEACIKRESAAAAGSTERQIAKMAANSVLGKTVENSRRSAASWLVLTKPRWLNV
jgi:hypothetical protein